MLALRTLTFAAAVASLCYAQDSPAIQIKVVKGAPFSATVSSETTQTLADGSHVTRTSNATIARDNEGRTRREQPGTNGGSIVFLQDPVAGYGYVIDTNKKSVHRYTTSNASDSAPISQNTGKSLGSQVIEGLPAEGTRLTRTIDSGEAGNERAFDVVVDAWYSADLQTVLLRKTTDPRVGETVYKLTNIQRGEPDASLFQIPVGFAIHEDVTAAK